ncbi:UDP-N-acetylmuramoyl-tripeptide--D-alanyl-D-alanine ligase [Sedimentibacter acidaminivorans]|uniref:UDP-N-acetylmuramoyl-tripeptide--D-alanyl-D-alanine ligase n=1 Tax=Sedimentibacter acidaminivorans TaxID=913099 RepID=A0ABS4GCU9_9FIRM|nr:UDP-N-acetylmuramoyl-tripeptide--D-alanyl-D-alanine ligase [Sedimentibacter acidaminivorans]MBP1925520.1 UDP-N-acetylmuramoyl-tripeptide--D-alanyl-D-alanine ligase [Sedimentibacter acidaminivorans]
MILFIIISFVVFWFLLCAVKIKYFIHMMQLESYKSNKYIEWLQNQKDRLHRRNDKIYVILSIVLLVVFLLSSSAIKDKTIVFAFIISFVTIVFFVISYRTKYESKKPIVYTQRAKRLYAMTLFLVVIDFAITVFIVLLVSRNLILYFPLWAGIQSILYYFLGYYVLFANYLVKPIENKINKKFYFDASKKIKELNNIISVGITGSYGKTSTKFITATILEEKYKVLKTPDSYNTPMGISKVINNDMSDEYDIFIAELGATHIGDIDEVAVLTNPTIGLITSIGPCHLETFKSIDNIMRTKYELIERLPNDGTSIFNYDNEYVKKLADKTFKEKILYGIENIEITDIFATDIRVSETGSTFTLCINELGTIECKTKLLGKHNILNILAGCAVAKVLGLTLEQMAAGISKIESVKHRLELIDPGTGVIVIDDAFNSNPDGAKAALDVLDEFKDRRKIIVTPGMVELGEIEEEENEKFGEYISKVCDVVILVGEKRTAPIVKGFQKLKYSSENLFIVNSLDEASEILKSLTKVNDVVLFENDLPDTYSEK